MYKLEWILPLGPDKKGQHFICVILVDEKDPPVAVEVSGAELWSFRRFQKAMLNRGGLIYTNPEVEGFADRALAHEVWINHVKRVVIQQVLRVEAAKSKENHGKSSEHQPPETSPERTRGEH